MDLMHRHRDDTRTLADAILAYALARMQLDPVPLGGPSSSRQLDERCGQTVVADGIGGLRALQLFDEVLSRACISIDHPRFLSFIPSAPTESACLFDLVVGASSIYAGTWLEGAGAVWAENQALRWLMDLAGYPQSAGGVFVSGGTTGNLSALVTARHRAQARLETAGATRPARWVVVASAEAHSSIQQAARVMDVDTLLIPADANGRLCAAAVQRMIEQRGTAADIFAIAATAGTTNYGIIDDLPGLADLAARHGIWLHADGAYGAAALAAPSVRAQFDGIERTDSFIVDPHKWLFAPYDACALLYRDPAPARAAHTQHAGYLDVIDKNEWNPSDLAVHQSRRARGLPFWFSLATHGTRAYADAIEHTIAIAAHAAQEVRRRPNLELVREPGLSVVVFRRIGWNEADYDRWSKRLFDSGHAFVTPTKHKPTAETCTRLAIVNPRTTRADIDGILDSMA